MSIRESNNIYIRGCNYLNNSAARNGGGMSIFHSRDVEISDCLSYYNTADTYGGGMEIDVSGNIKVMGGLYQSNTATGLGGGIWFGSVRDVEKSNCLYYNNTSFHGGAIGVAVCWLTPHIWIRNCDFYNNHADNGGGILVTFCGANITVTSTTGYNNFIDDISCKDSSFYFDEQSYNNITSITEVKNCKVTVIPDDDEI